MYRQYGHLSAKTDPLNRKNISEHLDIKKAVSGIFSDLSSEKENNKKTAIDKKIRELKCFKRQRKTNHS